MDWLFHGSSFRYFYRKYSGILRIALYVCGLFQRIFPENVLPGRYQTADASDRSQRFFMQSDHLFPVIFITGDIGFPVGVPLPVENTII